MIRALLLSTLVLIAPAVPRQTPAILHIKVVLIDADRKATPVPRHALLISDNPASAPPRRVVTGLEGTVDVRLRPGNYTVESEKPVAFDGKSYQWIQTLDVAAGKDAVLELTAGNAEVEAAAPTASTPSLERDPAFLLPKWQDSVAAIWTATTRASGFVIGSNGLLLTSQRAIGAAATAEVQFTPTLKVAATVLAADAERDVAVLWIDSKAAAAVPPVPLACATADAPRLTAGVELFAIGAPFRQRKGMTSGTVTSVEAGSVLTDIMLGSGGAGGPVFSAGGEAVGLTSSLDDNERTRGRDSRVVRSETACAVIAAAEAKMKSAAPPAAAPLPVEPAKPFPLDALKANVDRRAGGLNPYQLSSSTFDVAFITPVLTYAAQYQIDQSRRRENKGQRQAPDPVLVRPLMDFGTWTDYVSDFPPVLLVRATPKFAEGFWTMVARGAARTQGLSIPAIKRFKSGFARMRAFCGESEVTPIHPFKVERRISDTESLYEGLYVFDPGALGPQCGTVKLVLYSEKEPERGDTRVVDPKMIEQIWKDYEPYRLVDSR
jgi:hypothetical protein